MRNIVNTATAGAGPESWDWEAARSVCLREARRTLRDPHAAEDAAQEALIRAWKASDSCRTPDAAAWLRAIAANEARRLAVRRARVAVTETVHGADPKDERRDATDERLGQIALDQILAVLPAADGRLMRLRYIAGLSQPQIARCLGIPEGTVKVQLHRGRARLRTLLE